MELAEKILALRTALGLSQQELAERLEVSRQSVSKWETGQSVPDLDKIVRMAGLFGVTVDELVRGAERPQPPQSEPRVVYVREKQRLTGPQTAGVCMELSGLALDLLGLVGEEGVLILVGTALILMGLPLLLARRHPVLLSFWVLAAGSWLVVNPRNSAVNLLWAARQLLDGEALHLGSVLALARLGAVLVLALCTGYVFWKGRKPGKERTA